MKHLEGGDVKNVVTCSGSRAWEEEISCWSGYADVEQMGREVTKKSVCLDGSVINLSLYPLRGEGQIL